MRRNPPARAVEAFADLPIYDSHAHIGAIAAVGGGFRRSPPLGTEVDHTFGTPAPEASSLDLLTAPYLSMLLSSLGYQRRGSGAPEHERIAPYLAQGSDSGVVQALDLGLRALYGVDSAKAKEADASIRSNYRKGVHRWAEEALSPLGVVRVINPVHLRYIAQMTPEPFWRPALRTDDLLGYPHQGRHDFSYLYGILDLELVTVDDVERMVDGAFELLAARGVAIIKQATAYVRTLAFERVSRRAADLAVPAALQGDAEAVRIVQDFVMHRVFAQASDRGWPYQIHTGMTNLPHSSPALLAPLVTEYPGCAFVLLHGYPYHSEAAFLARQYRNVYFDLSWLSLQSPALLRAVLDECLGMVPYPKLFLSTDATNVEEAYGAHLLNRHALARVLDDRVHDGIVDADHAATIARALLHDNAVRLYET